MITVCSNCGRIDDSGLPVCSCGFSHTERKTVRRTRPTRDARQRLRHWKIGGRIIFAGGVAVLLSAAGLLAVVLEAGPKVESAREDLWSLSDGAAQAVVQTIATSPERVVAFDARVTAVPAGSIVTVVSADQQQHQIRLAGTTAPALDENFGRESRENLSHIAMGRTVRVIPLKFEKGVIVGKIMRHGTNLGLEQIRAGMARFDKSAAAALDESDRRLFVETEAFARLSGIGIWFDQRPVETTATAHTSERATERTVNRSF